MSTVAKSYITQLKPVRDMPASSGWTLRTHAADPEPTPTCLKRGHVWGPRKHNGIPDGGVTVTMCTRCAKRGAYVFLTEWSEEAVARSKQHQIKRDQVEVEQLRRRLAQLEASLEVVPEPDREVPDAA